MKINPTFKALTLLFALANPVIGFSEPCPELLHHEIKKLRSSETIDFCKSFQGKVILAVNTASNCGFTPQFKGLEALYQKYKDQGLVVVGFPSNDFKQEFDDENKTAEVCYLNYGVTFPMMTTSGVSGSQANSFFKQLSTKTDTSPQWNFYKYLISRDAKTVSVHSNRVTPSELATSIENLINVN